MKQISSQQTFDYKVDGATVVHVSPTPLIVEDSIAEHLFAIFGTLISITEVGEVNTAVVSDNTTGAVVLPADAEVVAAPVVEPAGEEPVQPAASGGGFMGMFK